MSLFNVKNLTIAGVVLACGAGLVISQENNKLLCSINPWCYVNNELSCNTAKPSVCVDKNNIPATGKLNKYYGDGQIAMSISLKDGIYNGPVYLYHKNGHKAKLINYKDGIAQGAFNEYYPSGKLEREGFYVDGNIHGISKVYYENGKLRSEIDVKEIDKSGESTLITATEKEFYEDGTLKQERNLQRGNGVVKMYHSNGLLLSQGEYKNGLQNGEFKDYYDDGKLRVSYTMVDGKVNGISTHYFEDGETVFMVLSMKDGTKHGEVRAYSRNGKLQEIAEYENDVYVHHTFLSKNRETVIFKE